MKITSTEFVIGATDLLQLPKTPLKEIACLGRSNVGKSSLISSLLQQKQIARSGKRPGKTRELNYFLVNRKFHFVDLPGYGYAKLPDRLRMGLATLIERYLKERRNLVLALQLIDARHEPTELDLMMVGWLEYYRVPFIVILTKSDKIPRSKMKAHSEEAGRRFARFGMCRQIVQYSSKTGLGRRELLQLISLFLQSVPTDKPTGQQL